MKLTNLEFFDYQKLVLEVYEQEKKWRLGQTYFNVLSDLYPVLAEEIRGSKYDPFYKNDEDLYEFFKYITKSC